MHMISKSRMDLEHQHRDDDGGDTIHYISSYSQSFPSYIQQIAGLEGSCYLLAAFCGDISQFFEYICCLIHDGDDDDDTYHAKWQAVDSLCYFTSDTITYVDRHQESGVFYFIIWAWNQ